MDLDARKRVHPFGALFFLRGQSIGSGFIPAKIYWIGGKD
jgi:hypothetical protein